jgi:hypothetical protein
LNRSSSVVEAALAAALAAMADAAPSDDMLVVE